MSEDLFGDLLFLRKGGPDLTRGSGPSILAPVETAGEWAIKAQALRDLFELTLGVQPPVECPLDLRVEGEWDRGAYLERRYSYQVEPDERVASIALIPTRRPGAAGRLPGVLCIHPTNTIGKEMSVGRDDSPRGMDRAYAVHLAERGYVTLSPDLLGAGERIYPGRGHFDNGPLYEKHPAWSGTGKDVWDMRRALDVLSGMAEVDGSRLGSIGHSQGGSVTVYTAVLDERVKAAVCSCGLWPYRISKNPFNRARTSWWIGQPALRAFCYAGKPMPVDIHDLFACIAPRALLNLVALNDFQYTLKETDRTRPAWEALAQQVQRVYALLGAGDESGADGVGEVQGKGDGGPGFQQVLHTKGHGFEAEERALAYAFLDRALTGA